MTSASWERRTGPPLMAAAVAFLASYAWPILDPSLSPAAKTACAWVAWGTWALFAVDYGVRLKLADDRWQFIRSTPLDLAAVLLPVLRPLRLLRLVALLSVFNRHAGSSLRGRVGTYLAGASALLVFVAALAVLDAERANPEANIVDFGDALWWAMTTITTVGYGDRYPTTDAGRTVAVGLMVAGIAVLGTVTATIASWLIERVTQAEEAEQAATRAQVEHLTDIVEGMRQEVRRLLDSS